MMGQKRSGQAEAGEIRQEKTTIGHDLLMHSKRDIIRVSSAPRQTTLVNFIGCSVAEP